MSRRPWVPVAMIAALVFACDDQIPTEVKAPDPLDPAVRPRVVSTYPPDGGIGPFELYQRYGADRPHYIIRFDKLIDTNRFESRWLRMEGFESPVEFRPVRYSLQLTDVLAVAVRDSATGASMSYQIGSTYTVTVDTTLRDATGNHPAAPHRFSFVPEPYFRVVCVAFERGQVVWSRDRVTLAWNAVPAFGIGASIRFDPPVQGTWTGSDDLRIFTHEQPFAFRTTYVLRVDETAMDAQGNRMGLPFATAFQVEPFEIAATNPRDGWGAVWPIDRRFFVAVTGPVDTASVPGAFAVTPALSGRFVWGTTSFAFEASADLQPSTPYSVDISAALRAWDGTALEAPYMFTFTTDTFRVVDRQPYPGAVDVALGTAIEMWFNMELDPVTIEPAFAIAPPVSGTFTLPDPATFQFRPDAPLAAATHYEVTISSALCAANRAAFPAPYTFSFWTRTP